MIVLGQRTICGRGWMGEEWSIGGLLRGGLSNCSMTGSRHCGNGDRLFDEGHHEQAT